MYKLITSANCGYSYQCEKRSNNIDDFDENIKLLNKHLIRWYIEVDHKPEIDYNPGGII